MDVDSLFALDTPTPEEPASTVSSSVFFDGAPGMGRASRFRQLFAQDRPPAQPLALEQNSRPGVDRTQSNPMFSSTAKSSVSAEDREGFQRIMAMLGGAGNKPPIPNVTSTFELLMIVFGKATINTASSPPFSHAG